MKSICITSAFLVIASFNINAATYNVTAIDQGWYRSDGLSKSSNTNYSVGNFESFQYRNWFVFNLSAINLQSNERITSATMSVDNGQYVGGADEQWVLTSIEHSYSPLISAHASGSNEGVNIFNDLADGHSYGSRTITANQSGPVVVNLTGADFASEYTSSIGGTFGIGGRLNTLSGADNEYILGGTGNTYAVLSVETTVVPVPATVWLFGSGLLGLVGMARRKANA